MPHYKRKESPRKKENSEVRIEDYDGFRSYEFEGSSCSSQMISGGDTSKVSLKKDVASPAMRQAIKKLY